MQQIADWLEKLGMSEYAKRFADNGVDLNVLPDLTDQDLRELGVLLGHRRKMLRAITELKDSEHNAPKPAVTALIAPQSHDTAERRQVTVMFSDLVGSTALAADPDFPPPTYSVWEESKHAWIRLPEGIQHFQQARS